MEPNQEVPATGSTLGDLLERTLPQLRAFVRRRLGARLAQRECVSDVVQSACREVLIDLQGEAISSEMMRKHLTVAADRKLADLGRKHAAERRSISNEVALDSRVESIAKDRSPHELASLRDDVERVESALHELAKDDRDVIVLAVVLGLSHAEIAHQLGSTVLATRSRLSRALARLALRL